jgi:hypothetical protein
MITFEMWKDCSREYSRISSGNTKISYRIVTDKYEFLAWYNLSLRHWITSIGVLSGEVYNIKDSNRWNTFHPFTQEWYDITEEEASNIVLALSTKYINEFLKGQP